jgi:hypothetical protein
MYSVNYNVGNDIPSQLLKNLAQTLGWSDNISPITNTNFLESVFGNTSQPEFIGLSRNYTPDELNFQFYRNLILNSSYLFKSKGTRKSIESLLKLIGAPDALVEFNENIYVADQKINMSQFNTEFASISGGTYARELPSYDPEITFKIQGREFTGYTIETILEDVDLLREDYPVDQQGYPMAPEDNSSFYFQIGAGWFEQTPQHRSNEIFNATTSTFTGANVDVQTTLEPFTYGQKYLNRFKNFPYTDLGFSLSKTIDNKWLLVRNEGMNLNSNMDDFGITFLNDTIGYFSSNRTGGKGKDDIYWYSFTNRSMTISGTVLSTENPLDGALNVKVVFLKHNYLKCLNLESLSFPKQD